MVTLTLTFHAKSIPGEEPEETPVNDVKAYPNPSLNYIIVEADDMRHVELYDNDGRLLEDYNADGKKKLTIDLATRPSGIYYLRVHSAAGVTIQKFVKL